MWVDIFHVSLVLAGRWMLKIEPGIRKQIPYRDYFTRKAVDYDPHGAFSR
jgi:hypothetical protein